MADKLISQLQLISAMDSDVLFAGDDGITTYRVSGAQLSLFFHQYNRRVTKTLTTSGTDIDTGDRVVLLNPTSASFTQALPALAGLPDGFNVTFKNIATNGNEVTLDANSTELIDNAETLVLGSDPSMDSVTLLKTSTKWLRIA